MKIQQKVASCEKIRKRKTIFVGQANGSKVVYFSADLMRAFLVAGFHLYVEYYVT